jgi:hypothetical protein
MQNLKLLTSLLILIMAPAVQAEIKLKPFETDGCTLFIDGPPNESGLWRNCCVEHDLRYWFGGSDVDMDATDLRLKSCVDKVAGATWASLIYSGVRTGHHSPIKNKYQWSWGWAKKREYKKLNPEEVNVVKAELKLLNLPQVDMPEFLKFYFP